MMHLLLLSLFIVYLMWWYGLGEEQFNVLLILLLVIVELVGTVLGIATFARPTGIVMGLVIYPTYSGRTNVLIVDGLRLTASITRLGQAPMRRERGR